MPTFLPILYLLLIIAERVFWIYATNAILYNKGYSERWTVAPLIFGLFAFAYALTKEDVYVYQMSRNDSENDKDSTWKCSCGTRNPNYSFACKDCGKTQAEAKKMKSV